MIIKDITKKQISTTDATLPYKKSIFPNKIDKTIEIVISIFGFYRMSVRPTEENPDSTFTPLPRNITPLGIELDPTTGTNLSSKDKK